MVIDIVQFWKSGRWSLDPGELFVSLERCANAGEQGESRRALERAITALLSDAQPPRRSAYPSLQIRQFCKRLLNHPDCPKDSAAALCLYTITSELVLQRIQRPIASALRDALYILARLDARQAQIVLLYQVAGLVPLSIAEYMELPAETVASEISTGQIFLQAQMARSGFRIQDLEQEGIRCAREVTVLLEAGHPLRDIAGQRYDFLRQKARSVKRRFSHDPLYDTTEAVNEAVIRLLDKTEQQPRDEAEFLGLFFKRLRHVAIDHGRLGKKRGAGAVHVAIREELDAALPELQQNPEEEALGKEFNARWVEAMRRLDRELPLQAKLLRARYAGSPRQSIEELARSYGVSEATIKRRLKEAVEFLREMVNP